MGNNTVMPVISRIVHLIRDPFSNVVARYHHARLVHTQQHDTSWLKKHPNNKNGFHRWCQEMDVQDILIQEDEEDETNLKRERDKEIVDMINDNIAVPMEWMHGYPTYILYYEELKADEPRLDVLRKIASFLKWNVSLLDIELSQKYMPIFRNYTSWYTNIELRNINHFLYKWAYPQTLEFIQRYL